MKPPVSYLKTTPLEERVKSSFYRAHLSEEYTRAMRVRALALLLAKQYGLDANQVSAAALLHNISRLLPESSYLETAHEYNVEVLPTEQNNPALLHQKISRILAVEQFNIGDKEVLNAIACHTTLRPSATLLDKIIFWASKQCNTPAAAYTFGTRQPPTAEKDLNAAIYSYLFNLLHNSRFAAQSHPWAQAALAELKPLI